MSEFWIIDNDTYNKLQPLKTFVDFVAGLKYSTPDEKQKAIEIRNLIDNIDKPETFKSWNVCLDIFDTSIQNGNNKEGGVYWRKWSVYFELEFLEIEAMTKHIEDPINHYGNDYYYGAFISFGKEPYNSRLYFKEDLKMFIEDAKCYEKYITASLNEVEVDIDID